MKRLLVGWNLTAAMILCLGCSGCVLSHTLARQVLRAPNQQSTLPKELNLLSVELRTNFVTQRIPVGPPAAALELMVLEPGDYGAVISSTIIPRRGRSGSGKNSHQLVFGLKFLRYSPKTKLTTNEICGTIFLLHGYGLGKVVMVPWGLVLAKAGYRVVLVDLRGHGHSTGDHIYFGGVERADLA